ncbi:MAG TPA: M20/M25/M40 family metallo-hydrolase [Gemmatimonadales bacterium]|nr:M20/M25/M40 family metallo-hydrolase [Gemmatimonadales bacterium]
MRRALLMVACLAAASRAQAQSTVAEADSILARLIPAYGVSGTEGPVRDVVKSLLPAWAKTETDTAGNLWLTVGPAGAPVVYVAHMDEIGYRVTGIREDGMLEVERQGGFFESLFEGKPALVHTPRGDVPGVFPPRDSIPRDRRELRHQPTGMKVDVGTTSRAATEALGVTVSSTVTMPKSYQRLAGNRATGRSFDDRVGDAALILVVRHLDRSKLKHQVVFVWSTREETGLFGAAAAAHALGTTPVRVHAIDTFVSSDAPLDPKNFADQPLGRGAVVRAVDNSSVTPTALVDTVVALAGARHIQIQVGTTNGGNDGSWFVPFGVPNVAMGWPLRYSHSPAEVIDLADVASLADILQATAEAW